MNNLNCQELIPLVDKKGKKEKPWRVYKLQNSYLSMAYSEVDANKAQRLENCASWLEFSKTEGGLKLHNANFCRVRLCPICAWRRSLKTYGQVRSVVDKLENNYKYIFLTLTCRNCDGEDLSTTLTKLFQAYNRLFKYKEVKQVAKGYYRGLEITHNLQEDTFHPHFHVLIAVNKSYFKSRYYISQCKWSELWQKALQVAYNPIVDVRKVNGTYEKAVAEVAKYATKSSEVICFDDWDLTVKTVSILDKALNNRRLAGWGGIFKEVHKELHLDDSEDGDLLHTETTVNESEEELEKIVYTWHTGYNQYYIGK